VVEITPAPPEMADALRRRQLLALRRFLEDVSDTDRSDGSPEGTRLEGGSRIGPEEVAR
jgi:hypothetical protein